MAMPSRKGKGEQTATHLSQTQTQTPESASAFPFARYTSIVGVHSSLLAFSALILPSTSLSDLSRLSGRTDDEPQRDFMLTLTENPVRTVAWICAGAVILQSWWASWVRTWSVSVETHGKKNDGPEDLKRRVERKDWKKRRVVVLGQAAAMTAAASLFFHVVAVLLGAPLASHPLHTYSMSLLLAVLTVLPPAYTLGPPSLGSDSPALVARLTWVRLFAELSPRTPTERALVYPAVGAVTGCWAGAVPIGLDWERPWQAWPLTPSFGAVGGFISGSLVALVVNATLELARADWQAQQAPPAAGKLKGS